MDVAVGRHTRESFSSITRSYVDSSVATECCECSQPIHGTVVNALGRSFHPQHFRCKWCGTPFDSSQRFFEQDGDPACSSCFLHKFADICAECRQPIEGEEIQMFGFRFHPWHANCATCRCLIQPNAKVYLHEGKIYCFEDFSKLFGPRCNGCKQPVAEQGVNTGHMWFHPMCFRCATCYESVTADEHFVHNFRVHCLKCKDLVLGPPCVECEEPVGQRAIAIDGKHYHDRCLRCTDCQNTVVPTQAGLWLDKVYCKACHTQKFRPSCQFCGRKIDGIEWAINWWEQNTCSHHRRADTDCFDCGRVLPPAQWHAYSDGRKQCSACQDNAITSVEDANALCASVRNWLEGALDVEAPCVPVELVTQNALVERTNRSTSGSVAAAHSALMCTALTEVALQKHGPAKPGPIYLLHGLSYVRAGHTLAHELGHCWLAQLGLSGMPALVQEGVCDLLALLYLQSQSAREARFREAVLCNNPHPVYAASLNRARQGYDSVQGSMTALVQHLRSHGLLVPGQQPECNVCSPTHARDQDFNKATPLTRLSNSNSSEHQIVASPPPGPGYAGPRRDRRPGSRSKLTPLSNSPSITDVAGHKAGSPLPQVPPPQRSASPALASKHSTHGRVSDVPSLPNDSTGYSSSARPPQASTISIPQGNARGQAVGSSGVFSPDRGSGRATTAATLNSNRIANISSSVLTPRVNPMAKSNLEIPSSKHWGNVVDDSNSHNGAEWGTSFHTVSKSLGSPMSTLGGMTASRSSIAKTTVSASILNHHRQQQRLDQAQQRLREAQERKAALAQQSQERFLQQQRLRQEQREERNQRNTHWGVLGGDRTTVATFTKDEAMHRAAAADVFATYTDMQHQLSQPADVAATIFNSSVDFADAPSGEGPRPPEGRNLQTTYAAANAVIARAASVPTDNSADAARAANPPGNSFGRTASGNVREVQEARAQPTRVLSGPYGTRVVTATPVATNALPVSLVRTVSDQTSAQSSARGLGWRAVAMDKQPRQPEHPPPYGLGRSRSDPFNREQGQRQMLHQGVVRVVSEGSRFQPVEGVCALGMDPASGGDPLYTSASPKAPTVRTVSNYPESHFTRMLKDHSNPIKPMTHQYRS